MADYQGLCDELNRDRIKFDQWQNIIRQNTEMAQQQILSHKRRQIQAVNELIEMELEIEQIDNKKDILLQKLKQIVEKKLAKKRIGKAGAPANCPTGQAKKCIVSADIIEHISAFVPFNKDTYKIAISCRRFNHFLALRKGRMICKQWECTDFGGCIIYNIADPNDDDFDPITRGGFIGTKVDKKPNGQKWMLTMEEEPARTSTIFTSANFGIYPNWFVFRVKLVHLNTNPFYMSTYQEWFAVGIAAADTILVSNQRLGHCPKSMAISTEGWRGPRPDVCNFRGFKKGDVIQFFANPFSRQFIVYLNDSAIVKGSLPHHWGDSFIMALSVAAPKKVADLKFEADFCTFFELPLENVT